jgi:hypothetical protein
VTQIKIQREMSGAWISVAWLHDEERPGWVKIREENKEPEWVKEEQVHPADQVVLRVERLAYKRYEWVPKEDLEGGPESQGKGE